MADHIGSDIEEAVGCNRASCHAYLSFPFDILGGCALGSISKAVLCACVCATSSLTFIPFTGGSFHSQLGTQQIWTTYLTLPSKRILISAKLKMIKQ